jgi:hypothetical protein
MIHSPVHFRTPFSDFRYLLRIAYSVNRKKINDLVEMAFGIKRAISRMRKSYGGMQVRSFRVCALTVVSEIRSRSSSTPSIISTGRVSV